MADQTTAVDSFPSVGSATALSSATRAFSAHVRAKGGFRIGSGECSNEEEFWVEVDLDRAVGAIWSDPPAVATRVPIAVRRGNTLYVAPGAIGAQTQDAGSYLALDFADPDESVDLIGSGAPTSILNLYLKLMPGSDGALFHPWALESFVEAGAQVDGTVVSLSGSYSGFGGSVVAQIDATSGLLGRVDEIATSDTDLGEPGSMTEQVSTSFEFAVVAPELLDDVDEPASSVSLNDMTFDPVVCG